MKKLFVSQPMKGLTPEEIKETREKLIAYAEKQAGEKLEALDTYFEGDEDWTPLDYLAESIRFLAKADLVVFGKGWSDNRGCKVERLCAEEYDVPFIDEEADEDWLYSEWVSHE